MKLVRHLLLVAAVGAAATANMSCNVNDYCLNCARGDGGDGDGGGSNDDGGLDDGGIDDGDTDGGCVNTGPEVCDNKDNDCDGVVDEGPLPQIGELCDNQMGECAGGVKECTNGVVTCSKPPTPEICDLKDNDCNGLTDEGDPGGGAVCGTNTGECVAGVNRCISGTIQCVGAVGPSPETCNNRDDDCDSFFDENLVLGACVPGVDGPIQGNTGECNLGQRQCIGGVTTCVGAVFPTFELCDPAMGGNPEKDQDCDGQPHNGYNTNTDPQNCGGCGNVCNLPNAFEGCAGGMCTVVACAPNFFDNDLNPANGCEFDCGHPFLGNEVCNGIDDDCDGLVDEADPDLVAPVGLCDSDGACATQTVLSCDGALGWRCHYNNPNVQTSDPDRTQIMPETRCDSDIVAGTQADNDCDGRIDEGQANLAQECDNGLFGDCRNSGAYVCNPANRNGPAVCEFTQMGPGPSVEICDGRDNNCNNQIDEGAATGNLPGQNWVTIPGLSPAVQIMQYEASRPDATATLGGTAQGYACSRSGVQPWANITQPEAAAVCSSIGARLCTEAEWQTMCQVQTTYPATGVPGPSTTNVTDFTFIEAEDAYQNTTIGGANRAWTRVAPPNLNGVTAMQVPDLGFGQNVAANALTQSSRLDYRLNLVGGQNYRVFMRMRSPDLASVTGVAMAPTANLSPVSHASTEVGDLVIVVSMSRIGAGPPNHTIQPGFTEIRTQILDEGSSDARLSIAYRVATVAGAQTYAAYTSNNATSSLSGIFVIRAGRYNLSQLLHASVSSTTSSAPNPPGIGPVAGNSIVLAIGGWRLSNTYSMNASAPTGFTEAWEAGGSPALELSLAAALIASGGSVDPAAFGHSGTGANNVTGTTAMTIAIGLNNIASNSVWVGMNAGGTAGAANAANVATTGVDRWEWVVSPQFTAAAGGGLHTFSIYTREDGAMIDTIAVARHTTTPTFDNIWAYQNNPRTAQAQACNGDEYDTDPLTPGDQDGILATGSRPMCFANQAGANDAYDMSGNVKEWTAERTGGQNPIRGGASNNVVTGLTCQLNFTLADDDFFFPNVGFRCCR